MKRGLAVIALAGLALAIALIAYSGWHAIARSLLAVGWGILLLTAYHVLPMGCSAIAWRVLLRDRWDDAWWVFLQARWIRENVAHLLPVAQVGGEAVGARILVLRGLAAPVAAASVIVDLTLEALSQVVFTLMGLGVLAALGDSRRLLLWLSLGAVLGACSIGGFFWAQRRGLFAWLEKMLQKLSARSTLVSLGRLDGLNDAIQSLYARPRRAIAASVYHLLCWIVGIGETWLALYFMGHPVGWADALFLESLGEAIIGAAFFIPGQLGIQEGGYMLLGQIIGLPAEAGLTLSLIKRVRVLLLGLPALAAWQFVESRSLLAKR